MRGKARAGGPRARGGEKEENGTKKRGVVNTRQIIMRREKIVEENSLTWQFLAAVYAASPPRESPSFKCTGLSRVYFRVLFSFFSCLLSRVRPTGNEFYDAAVVIWLIIMIMTVII